MIYDAEEQYIKGLKDYAKINTGISKKSSSESPAENSVISGIWPALLSVLVKSEHYLTKKGDNLVPLI